MGNKYFPLFVNLEKKKILLIGAGNIALRRARGVLDFGAELTVVAPEIATEFFDLQDQYGKDCLVIVKHGFEPGSIDGFEFVLSATNDRDIDLAVYQECKEKGIPVNVASDQSLCDFYFPALVQEDNIVIGVSSGGDDHGKVRRVSAKIREWMKEQ